MEGKTRKEDHNKFQSSSHSWSEQYVPFSRRTLASFVSHRLMPHCEGSSTAPVRAAMMRQSDESCA